MEVQQEHTESVPATEAPQQQEKDSVETVAENTSHLENGEGGEQEVVNPSHSLLVERLTSYYLINSLYQTYDSVKQASPLLKVCSCVSFYSSTVRLGDSRVFFNPSSGEVGLNIGS